MDALNVCQRVRPPFLSSGVKMSEASSSPAQQKKSRSRTGCKSCKKSKIKCDEARPTCGNCQRCGKKCDYSLKLTWGGRPYKVPRVEKLNPIASLSRSQLEVEPASGGTSKGRSQSKTRKQTAIESKLQFKQPIHIINIQHEKPADPAHKNASPKRSLNPSENLNFLMKMSDPGLSISNLLHKEKDNRMIKPPLQKTKLQDSSARSPSTPSTDNAQCFQSLEESYTDPLVKKETSPVAQETSPFSNETMSSNIQNLNNMLGSLFNEKLTQFSPWSFLEQIDKSVNFASSDIPDLQSLTNAKISEQDNIVSSNSQLLSTPALNLISNDSAALSESDQIENYNLDEFADDLSKTGALNESSLDNLFSIPMMNESRRPAHNHHHHHNINEKLRIEACLSPSSTSSSMSEIMETIPRGLLPLPDLLLNAPYFYDSFLFFTNLTSSILTPADSSVYVNNPFKKVLPKLAMTNNGLMSLIVAFGSAHKSVLLKKDSTEIVESLLGRALSDLLVLLNNKETCTSDLTLTLVMFFTSFLVFNYQGDKWKVHMNGAKQIFLMRGYNRPFDKILLDYKTDGSLISGEIKKSKLLYFLIRWFAYIDLFSNLSSPLEPTEDEIVKYCSSSPSNVDSLSPISDSFSSPSSFSSPFTLLDPNNVTTSNANKQSSSTNEAMDAKDDPDNQIDYEVAETDEGLMKGESHQDIDYMLGFKIKFLPIFSQLCKLIKRVNLIKRSNERMNIASTTSSIALPPSIIESAINIQAKFQKLKFTVYDTSNTSRAKSLNAVIASNHCFLLMGMIQLYRRVLLIPRSSKVIQEMCLGIVNAMTKYIDTKQPNSLGLILPLFIAGCECQNVNVQPLFIQKLHDFQEKGSVSAESGIEIMMKCWETGRDWNEIMIEYDKYVVFL